ncbi:DUF4345 family protein [Paraflavitalea pollutisoli]|uniref:DUF4345 family protein n=1 Tax=Paraflavitalea pollutisoli TaxID=3034143 RepID=UPI0023EDEC7E|nr:DUF4345 family protein [Paraflavitalea sp. H1-2-19X]
MRQLMVVKSLLVIAGIISIIVGIGQLFFPVAFEASSGVDLGGNVSLLSEMRGAGGVLLGGGILIIMGAFSTSLRGVSLILTVLIGLGYGIARVYGMLVDGIPHPVLVGVAIGELVIGGLALLLYQGLRKPAYTLPALSTILFLILLSDSGVTPI